jgi:single-strand DNA-binding protein
MNQVVLIGRLCTEVDTRRTNSGKAVASYRMPVDRQIKQDGQPEADFLNCVAFGSNGEFAGKYLNKGMKIAVEGRIQTRTYDDKDGKKVYVTEIIVEHHEFCEKKVESSGNYGGYSAQAFPELPTAPAQDFEQIDEDDAQLPF